MLMINDARRVVDIMEIGVLVPFKFQVSPNGTSFWFFLTNNPGSTTSTRRIAGRPGRPP